MIFDETQCGVGRPGTYFSYQMMDPPVLPDVTLPLTVAVSVPVPVSATA